MHGLGHFRPLHGGAFLGGALRGCQKVRGNIQNVFLTFYNFSLPRFGGGAFLAGALFGGGCLFGGAFLGGGLAPLDGVFGHFGPLQGFGQFGP